MITYELTYIKNGFDGQGNPYSVKMIREFDFPSDVIDFVKINNIKEYKVFEVERVEINLYNFKKEE